MPDNHGQIRLVPSGGTLTDAGMILKSYSPAPAANLSCRGDHGPSRAAIEAGELKLFLESWQFWALLSAAFAALTAIFAKVGIENINSDFATFIRTIVILLALGGILAATGQFQPLNSISSKTYLFLILSGLATGASWIAYFRALKIGQAAQVAPVDKLSVVLVAIFGVIFLGEKLTGPNWLGIGLIMAGAVLVAWR